MPDRDSLPDLSKSHRFAMSTRADLLGEECETVIRRRISWAGRLRELAGYGRTGGSAGDRKLIVEAMAIMENSPFLAPALDEEKAT